MNTYEYQRSRSLFDLCPRFLIFILSNSFWCEAASPTEAKFHASFYGLEKKENLFKKSWWHVTKLATMPIYGKINFKNLLRNQLANYLRTWYKALGTQALQSLSWIDLDLLYGKNGDPWMTFNFFNRNVKAARRKKAWILD